MTIGAAASFSEIIDSPLVRETAPLLVEACHSVGAPQIRNMGTLGGNVANAAACADSLPALVCLDATAHALTPDGRARSGRCPSSSSGRTKRSCRRARC